MSHCAGKTYFITGASRGIGRSIALKLAGHGANIVIAAKTDQPKGDLDGTIHSVAQEVEAAGGQALAIKTDIRDEAQIKAAVDAAVERFGGVDGLINNASAIHVSPSLETPLKRYDLMMDINVRGTFACIQACLPHLLKTEQGGHILTMSPPINMKSKWIGVCPAYSASKYGMSMMALGVGREYDGRGIYSNTLWPATTIDTAAIRVHFPDVVQSSRSPQIVSDAVYHIMCEMDPKPNQQSFTDEGVLKSNGVKNFTAYAVDPKQDLSPDLFLD